MRGDNSLRKLRCLLIPKLDSQLLLGLTNNCWMSMGAASSRKQYIIDGIEEKRSIPGIFPFRDVDGTPHATFRTSFLKEYRILSGDEIIIPVTTVEQVRALDVKDHALSVCLHYRDGYQYIDASFDGWRNFLQELLQLMVDETDHLHTNTDGSQTRIEGEFLIGYAGYFRLTCQCPTPIVLNSGCPSARGQRCPNLGSLERVRVSV